MKLKLRGICVKVRSRSVICNLMSRGNRVMHCNVKTWRNIVISRLALEVYSGH